MKYELNIFIDVDDKNDTATLSVKGVNNENEEVNFLFTNSHVAKSLYNQIVMDIYKAGSNATSEVYQVENEANDQLKSENLRHGERVTPYQTNLKELYRLLCNQHNLIAKLLGELADMKYVDGHYTETEISYIDVDINTLKNLQHTVIDEKSRVKSMMETWPGSNEKPVEGKLTIKDYANKVCNEMKNLLFSFDTPSKETKKFEYQPYPAKYADTVDAFAKETHCLMEANDISNPSHYTEGRHYEPRLVIEDWGLSWNLGNTVKYISRAGCKDDPVKDLSKAKQYLEWEIDRMICEKTKEAGKK